MLIVAVPGFDICRVQVSSFVGFAFQIFQWFAFRNDGVRVGVLG